jgi:hypothetical protein
MPCPKHVFLNFFKLQYIMDHFFSQADLFFMCVLLPNPIATMETFFHFMFAFSKQSLESTHDLMKGYVYFELFKTKDIISNVPN